MSGWMVDTRSSKVISTHTMMPAIKDKIASVLMNANAFQHDFKSSWKPSKSRILLYHFYQLGGCNWFEWTKFDTRPCDCSDSCWHIRFLVLISVGVLYLRFLLLLEVIWVGHVRPYIRSCEYKAKFNAWLQHSDLRPVKHNRYWNCIRMSSPLPSAHP